MLKPNCQIAKRDSTSRPSKDVSLTCAISACNETSLWLLGFLQPADGGGAAERNTVVSSEPPKSFSRAVLSDVRGPDI